MVKQAYDYDLLVIGAGAAGSTAASTAAQNGIRVALVERDKIGGTCLNYGCDPTKAMIHVAGLLYQARHADRFGLRISEAKVDWTSVLSWVHQVQLRIRGGTSEEAAAQLSHKGIHVLPGEATFVSPHELTVAGKTISADRIIVIAASWLAGRRQMLRRCRAMFIDRANIRARDSHARSRAPGSPDRARRR